ncbi:MAG: tetratricopeptide repeat protein [Mucilaginibacter polytrichastri]|nr:tetratricopeptide repeat protein [Mucilaginibacter polytrichastri]
MKKILLLLFLVFCGTRAQAGFDFNTNCVNAYRAAVQLDFSRAQQLISQEKNAHPDNSIVLFLENTVDYYRIIMSNRKQDYDAWKSRRDARVAQINGDDANSPYYRYLQAHIHLQWALLHGQFGEFTAAGFAINKAHGLLQANEKKYPEFLPDNIDLAMVNVMLGSIPDGTLKSSLRFFGVKGDTRTGLQMLERLRASLPKSEHAFFYDELVFYLSHVQCDIVQDPNAFANTLKYAQSMPDSALKFYILGYAGVRTGHSKEALTWLGNESYSRRFPLFYYFQGVARLNQLDSGAKNAFQLFLKYNTGNFYVKDAYLRLGWIASLAGSPKETARFFSLVKKEGSEFQDKDKQALNEIADANPDPVLLKARLLFDGGLYARAAETLKSKPASNFTGRNRLEYSYRMGRILEEQGNDRLAVTHYGQAVSLGKNQRYYFAANSALRAGLLWQRHGDKARARYCYNQVMSMKNFQYEQSIKQKVRTALKQLGS